MNSIIFNIKDSLGRTFNNLNNRVIYNNEKYESIEELYHNYGWKLKLSSYLVTWIYQEKKHQLFFPNSNIHFFVDPISGLIVCRWFMLDGKLTNNTYFLNLDGTIHHKLKNPEVVYCPIDEEGLKIQWQPLIPSPNDDMSKIGFFPVEEIPATLNFDEDLNSLVGQYYYNYDWLLYRKYDALR